MTPVAFEGLRRHCICQSAQDPAAVLLNARPQPMNDFFQLEIEDARALINDMRKDPNAFDFQIKRTAAAR
jgi:hypothetical protein